MIKLCIIVILLLNYAIIDFALLWYSYISNPFMVIYIHSRVCVVLSQTRLNDLINSTNYAKEHKSSNKFK